MFIREATIKDFSAIKAIDTDLTLQASKLADTTYKYTLSTSGFLLPNPFTKQQFEKQLHYTFLVAEENKTLVGFVRTRASHTGNDRKATVFIPSLEENMIKGKFTYLDRLAVIPTYRGKRCAARMVEEVEKKVVDSGIIYLYSYVVTAPVRNEASIRFHETMGFERVDEALPFAFAGFYDYQSYKYCKKLR